MNITYFIPHLRLSSGMERVLAIKANYLADVLGHNITIITYSQHKSPIFFEFSPKINFVHLNIPDPTYTIKQYSFWKRRTIYRQFLNTYRNAVEQYLKSYPQDIAISMGLGLEHSFLPLIKDGSKKVLEYHFHYNITPFRILNEKWTWKNLKSKYYVNQLKHIYKKYDRIIPLTTSDEKDWKQYFSNTKVISNPITITPKERGTQNNSVLAIGRLEEQKGFKYLIDAWKIISTKYPSWKLNIYGDGSLKESLVRQITENNLQHSIFIHPPTKNIEQVYSQHPIYVLSSIYEGFVLSLLEAMASGCACVSTNCKHGPSDMITNGENGFLVNVGDINAIADKIMQLIENENLRQNFSNNAKVSMKQNYSVEQIMNKWVSLFNELSQK